MENIENNKRQVDKLKTDLYNRLENAVRNIDGLKIDNEHIYYIKDNTKCIIYNLHHNTINYTSNHDSFKNYITNPLRFKKLLCDAINNECNKIELDKFVELLEYQVGEVINNLKNELVENLKKYVYIDGNILLTREGDNVIINSDGDINFRKWHDNTLHHELLSGYNVNDVKHLYTLDDAKVFKEIVLNYFKEIDLKNRLETAINKIDRLEMDDKHIYYVYDNSKYLLYSLKHNTFNYTANSKKFRDYLSNPLRFKDLLSYQISIGQSRIKLIDFVELLEEQAKGATISSTETEYCNNENILTLVYDYLDFNDLDDKINLTKINYNNVSKTVQNDIDNTIYNKWYIAINNVEIYRHRENKILVVRDNDYYNVYIGETLK